MGVMQIQKIRESYFRLWEKLAGWQLFLFYVVHYTILFVVLSGVIFLPFFRKGFIWNDNDGMAQHFMRLVYISQTFREGIHSFLAGEGWNIPFYDFRSGLSVQDMQIGFPQILAVLWPVDKIDIFFTLYVIANYYLVGISFSVFGFFFRQKPLSVMTGAIAYAFCGYALYAGVRHPHFLVPMMFLPLLLVGVEKVLHKENAWLLTWMVFLSLTTQNGLYFSCMQVVFIAVYIVIRFFDVYEEERVREFVKVIGRMAVWGGMGILLGGVTVIPSLVAIAGSGRIGNDVTGFTNMLRYKAIYYKNFLLDFMVISNEIGNFFGCWVILGFSVVALPAVVLLFLRHKKKERSLRYLFIIFTAMLCIPAVAYVMSGFSNISGRFCFGYAFLVSAILMFMVPRFTDMEHGMMTAIGICLIIYFMVCYFVFRPAENQMRAFIMLLMAVLLFACCNLAGAKGRKWIPFCCLLVTCFSVWYGSYLKYSPNEGNYVKGYVKDPYEILDQGQYASFAQSKDVIEDTGFYRVMGDNILVRELEAAFYFDLNGVSMYPYFGWSNGYMKWLVEMEVARCTMQHRIYDLDARSALASLASVKYCAERKTETSFAPYGFVQMEEIQKDKNKDIIWKNEHSLPLGYTYENYIGRQQYSELNALGKQEIQLQAVVLEEEPVFNSLETIDTVTTAVQIPYEIADMNNLIWENGKIEVKESGATMTLAFMGAPMAETYLRIVDLDLTNGDNMDSWWVKADTGETSANAGFCADAFVYTHGQKTQMLNMGYSEEGYHTITVTFPTNGTFLLDDIEIWCQPMENYMKEIDKLNEETLENVKISGGGGNWDSLCIKG